MNILQMASNMKRNGPAMVVYDLAFGLADMGHRVYIAAGDGELVPELTHPNIHFVHIPIDRVGGNKVKRLFTYGVNAVKTYNQLKSLIEAEKIDVINSHQPFSNMYAKRLSRACHIPFVTTAHNVYEKGYLSNTYVSGDHVVACSDKVYENSVKNFGVKPDRITCIRNGINPDRLKATNPVNYPGKFVIGTLAGLRKQKALDKLISSFELFHKRVPESSLVIAGDGEEKEILVSLVDELGLNTDVHFLGFRNDSANVLAGLDVFALSSEYEGLPISMLEAMAMRIPVVVTPVGGIPWVIKDGDNGLICEYGDIEGMAAKFFKLYENKNLSSDLQEKAYESLLSDYSNKKMAAMYFEVYQALI